VNILVLVHSPFEMWNIPPDRVDRLRRDFPHHTFLYARTDEEARGLMAEADAAFSGQIPRGHLAAAPRLRWIHSPAAGVGGMLYGEMLERPVVITNSRGMAADIIAEHVVAVTLAMFRRLPLAVRRQAERGWAQDEIGTANRRLAGARVLVVGLGAIGGAAAERLAALGAVVTAVRRRTGLPAPGYLAGVVGPERLLHALADADVVVVSAAETAATRGLIGAQALAAMKTDAVLVNVSRGKLVDEAALADALAGGRIGGAALDVFEHEPLDPASPLWTHPDVLITPHTSGFAPDHWDRAIALFAENLRRFDAGLELLNVVDKHAGY
jgi:phosphoglycerate dehydrogenase-like enzyme